LTHFVRWRCWSSLNVPMPFLSLAKFGSDVSSVGLPVAGPDRPIPEKPKPRAARGYTEWEAGPSKAGATATSTARANSDLYNKLHSAVAERG
jgi:hypothetical protein